MLYLKFLACTDRRISYFSALFLSLSLSLSLFVCLTSSSLLALIGNKKSHMLEKGKDMWQVFINIIVMKAIMVEKKAGCFEKYCKARHYHR